MKIAIVGSRDYPRPEDVRAHVASLPEGTIVISGGARGVDTWAVEAVKARGLPEPIVYRVTADDWERIGKSAGAVRNKKVVDKADRIIAFWDGQSPGTRDAMMLADKLGKPVVVYVHDALGRTGMLVNDAARKTIRDLNILAIRFMVRSEKYGRIANSG